ncbi:hypothetical protein SPHINGOT1_300004 [Sphingomonas sp. T1]|nr:hypothetical protein SPHINGOT1_300004 [Sphingomonas sp. T1]
MAGHVQRNGVDVADGKAVAVLEQPVELGTVALKIGAGVEDFAEHVLNPDDLTADRELPAKRLLKIRCRRQVIGMSMGFQQPIDRQSLIPHVSDHCVRRRSFGPARRGVKIEDAVDDRSLFRRRVPNDVGRCVGRLIKEGLNDRRSGRFRASDLGVGFAQNRVHDHLRLINLTLYVVV